MGKAANDFYIARERKVCTRLGAVWRLSHVVYWSRKITLLHTQWLISSRTRSVISWLVISWTTQHLSWLWSFTSSLTQPAIAPHHSSLQLWLTFIAIHSFIHSCCLQCFPFEINKRFIFLGALISSRKRLKSVNWGQSAVTPSSWTP